MFLFRRDNTTVLYTGDFRYHAGETTRLRQLFNAYGPTLRYNIDSIYLDTTFCVPQATSIPSREACLSVIQDTIKKWLLSAGAVVHIFSRSRYGYEYLMVSLAKLFGCEIHVNPSQYSRYRYVPSLKSIMTTNPNGTKIHFCQSPVGDLSGPNRRAIPCTTDLASNTDVLTLIPSVMYFTKFTATPSQMIFCESERIIRVCYSSHSSYEEIVDFLKHLKPANIYPSVKPNNELSLEDVRKNLAFLEVRNKKKSDEESQSNV